MLFSDEANVVRVGSTFLNDKPIYLTSIIRGHHSGPVVLKELSNAIPTPI